MADKKFDLGDYVTVAERVQKFYAGHPDGRIQAMPPELVTLGDQVFIQVRAMVFRDPEDQYPAIATAWEPYPGKTPYTKDSEMMNAETSAVGRAIAFVGIEVNRSLASRDEVQARQKPVDSASQPIAQAVYRATVQRAKADGFTEDEWVSVVNGVTGRDDGSALRGEWEKIRDAWVAYKTDSQAHKRPQDAPEGSEAPQVPESPLPLPTAPHSAQSGDSGEVAETGNRAEVGSRARKAQQDLAAEATYPYPETGQRE